MARCARVPARGIGSGRSPVAPIPATDATLAPQNRSPPAHDYKPATAHCSTMPSTPQQCGCPCTADHQSRCRRSVRSAIDPSNPCPPVEAHSGLTISVRRMKVPPSRCSLNVEGNILVWVGQRVRGRVSREALRLFDRGYDETTVADIAAAAGVTQMTFSGTFRRSWWLSTIPMIRLSLRVAAQRMICRLSSGSVEVCSPHGSS